MVLNFRMPFQTLGANAARGLEGLVGSTHRLKERCAFARAPRTLRENVVRDKVNVYIIHVFDHVNLDY